jgi:hypothetical protein
MKRSTLQEGFGSSLIQGIAPIASNKESMFSKDQGSANFHGAGDSKHDPGFAYMRLEREGYGVWFKGKVTEHFPPKDPTIFPWDLVVYKEDETYKVKVAPGLIGGILPTNYDEEFVVNTGLNYWLVDCTTNGEVVTSATIGFNTSFPSPENATADKAPTSFKACFGMIDYPSNESPTAYNFWRRSPSAVPNAAYAIGPATPGQATTYYYVWRVG